MNKVFYSIGTYPRRKGFYLWRSEGVESKTIAKFTDAGSMLTFADEMGYPLSEDLKKVAEEGAK